MHVVWTAAMDDGAWTVTVRSPDSDWYQGELTVTDAAGNEIHHQAVPVAYGAPFGADVDDVFSWQDITVDVVEHPEKRVPR